MPLSTLFATLYAVVALFCCVEGSAVPAFGIRLECIGFFCDTVKANLLHFEAFLVNFTNNYSIDVSQQGYMEGKQQVSLFDKITYKIAHAAQFHACVDKVSRHYYLAIVGVPSLGANFVIVDLKTMMVTRTTMKTTYNGMEMTSLICGGETKYGPNLYVPYGNDVVVYNPISNEYVPQSQGLLYPQANPQPQTSTEVAAHNSAQNRTLYKITNLVTSHYNLVQIDAKGDVESRTPQICNRNYNFLSCMTPIKLFYAKYYEVKPLMISANSLGPYVGPINPATGNFSLVIANFEDFAGFSPVLEGYGWDLYGEADKLFFLSQNLQNQPNNMVMYYLQLPTAKIQQGGTFDSPVKMFSLLV